MDFNNTIELSNFDVYFLALELKKKQLIGIDLDWESINKEAKLDIKQEIYDRYEKEGILQQDFSGNSIVNDDYSKIVDFIELPHYCGIIELTNTKEQTSKLRKIYRVNNEYIALEYFTPHEFGALNIDNEHDANEFMFFDIKNPEFKEAITKEYASEEDIINDAEEIMIFSEYFVGEKEYDFIQTVSYQIDGIWYAAEKKNDRFSIVPCEDNFIIG